MAVMTTPRRLLVEEPPETAAEMVSVLSLKLLENREETGLPAGAVLSSVTAGRVVDPLATGASLTAEIEVESVTVAAE